MYYLYLEKVNRNSPFQEYYYYIGNKEIIDYSSIDLNKKEHISFLVDNINEITQKPTFPNAELMGKIILNTISLHLLNKSLILFYLDENYNIINHKILK